MKLQTIPFETIAKVVEECTTPQIKFGDLKKGDEIKSTQLGTPITGKLMESPKQGKGIKKVILIWSNGSEVNMFDEHGSVYATDIVEVKRGNQWCKVSHDR